MTDSNMSGIHRPEYEIIPGNPVMAPDKLFCLFITVKPRKGSGIHRYR